MICVYDFDGTLITPLRIDYIALKSELGRLLNVADVTPILDVIYQHPSKKDECFAILDRYECETLFASRSIEEVINMYLSSSPKIVVSRNGHAVISKFFIENRLPFPDFISCRDNCQYVKPNKYQIEHVRTFFPSITDVCVIGDSWHDKELARNSESLFFDVEQLKMSRIFITGGAGFIGSTLARKLLDSGHQVTIYDNLSTVNCGDENIRDLSIKFIHGDILNTELLTESMKGHDITIHLAAQLEITKSYTNSLFDLNTNLIGTINVVTACKRAGVKRLINASSACVYGFTNGEASKETDPTQPNWEYGASKLAAEKYVHIGSLSGEYTYTSLRFSIVYGEREWYGRVLTIFVKRALEGKPLVIFGDGEQSRDYVHVNDVCNFILQSLYNPNTFNKVYNVSTGIGTRIIDLAKLVHSKFPSSNIVFDNVKEGEISIQVPGRERLNHELRYLILDNTAAVNDVNWKPVNTLENSIDSYIDWVRNNIHNWNTLKV